MIDFPASVGSLATVPAFSQFGRVTAEVAVPIGFFHISRDCASVIDNPPLNVSTFHTPLDLSLITTVTLLVECKSIASCSPGPT
jgi:hypothetical protein